MITTSKPSNETHPTATVLPDLSLFGVTLIWGINLPVMKVGLDHIDVYAFNALRLLISAIVLIIFALKNKARKPFHFSWKVLWQIFQYAFLASGLYQIIFLLGIANTTSGNASLIMSTVPMWTALLALIFLNERLAKLAWGGLWIALVGTIIVTAQNRLNGNSEYLLGNAIMLVAAFTWACGTVKSRHLLNTISPLTLSAIASVMMLPLHFALAASSLRESLQVLPQIEVWLPLLYSGIFSTGIALFMWNYGVREAGAAHAAVFQNLIPVIAFISAWIVRGETISVSQMIGGVLIIGGLIVMRKSRSRQMRAAQQIELQDENLAEKNRLKQPLAMTK